jgi:hypothetical protein
MRHVPSFATLERKQRKASHSSIPLARFLFLSFSSPVGVPDLFIIIISIILLDGLFSFV